MDFHFTLEVLLLALRFFLKWTFAWTHILSNFFTFFSKRFYRKIQYSGCVHEDAICAKRKRYQNCS